MKTQKFLDRDLKQDIIDYFDHPLMYEEVDLVSSGVVKFHWSNWDKLLSTLNSRLSDGENIDSLSDLDLDLEDYRAKPVWFKNKQGSIVSNLFDLYSYFLDPRLKELWFEINEDTLISFESASGPFIRLQSMRWFDFGIYRRFIYYKLLKGSGLTGRQFRLSVNIPAEMVFVNSVLDPMSLNIVQMTKSGFLMKLESRFDLQKLSSVENIKLRVNFTAFQNAKNKEVSEYDEVFNSESVNVNSYMSSEFIFKKHILESYTNPKNIGYSNGEDFFLFISFNDLQQLSEGRRDVKDSVVQVIDKLESFAEAHLKKAKSIRVRKRGPKAA